MGDQRLPENQPGRLPSCKSQLPSKCVLKPKKEQVKFPSFLEDQRQQFLREDPDDFRRDYEPSEGLLSRTIQGTFFPRISHAGLSTSTTKSQRMLPQHQVDLRSQMENGSADPIVNLLQVPKRNQKLNNRWCLGENQRERSKKQSKYGRLPQRKLKLAPPKSPGSIQGSWLSEDTHQNQDLLDSLYYKHMKSRGDDLSEWDETFKEPDMMEQLEMGYSCEPSLEDSLDKKIGLLPYGLKYLKRQDKTKNIRSSKEEPNFEMKLRRRYGPPKSTTEKTKCETSNQKAKQSKPLENKESVTDPKRLLEIQGRSLCQPDLLENLYGAIAFKDFILDKGYNMPGILQKFFVRKGWDYDSVNTPLSRVLKEYKLIMQKQDAEDEEEKEFD